MNELQRRIKKLEEALKASTGGMFIVYFKDGGVKRIRPEDTIMLVKNDADKISRFEAESGGGDNGKLEGLINALLITDESEVTKI